MWFFSVETELAFWSFLLNVQEEVWCVRACRDGGTAAASFALPSKHVNVPMWKYALECMLSGTIWGSRLVSWNWKVFPKVQNKKHRDVPLVENVSRSTLIIRLCPPCAVIVTGEFLGHWFPPCFDWVGASWHMESYQTAAESEMIELVRLSLPTHALGNCPQNPNEGNFHWRGKSSEDF